VNQEKIKNFDNLKVGTEIEYYPISDFTGGGAIAASTTPAAEQTNSPSDNAPAVDSAASISEPQPIEAAVPTNTEAVPAAVTASAEPQTLPAEVKVTEKPADENPGGAIVKGGIPVDGVEGVGESASAESGPGGRPLPTETRRIRPPEENTNVEEEGFFTGNLRRFVYIGFIAIVFAGGIYLTRPNRKFKNRFTGIQPMPNPMAGTNPAPRPRVMPSTPNRVSVSKPAAPPPDKNEQKTG
jgi:hypothetical protein